MSSGRYVRRFRIAQSLKEEYGLDVSQHHLDQRLRAINEAAPWLSVKEGLGYGQGVSRMYSDGVLAALAEVSARSEMVRQTGGMDSTAAEEFALRSVAADLRRMPKATWPVEDSVVDAIHATLKHNRARVNSLDVTVEQVKEVLEQLRTRFGIDTADVETALDRATARATGRRSSSALALSSA